MKKNKITESSSSSFKSALKIVFAKKNMWSLAVGVLIGTAISNIVKTMAGDIITKSILNAFGITDIDKLQVNGIVYGKFLSSIIELLILAITMVIIVFVFVFIFSFIKNRHGNEAVETKVKSIDQQILEELKKINENLITDNKKKNIK